MEAKEYHYFPTQVYSFELPEERASALNKDLLATIYSEREADVKGTARSNFRELGGWPRNLQSSFPNLCKICGIINIKQIPYVFNYPILICFC